MTNGALIRILETLPPTMRLQDKSRTWAVSQLIAALQAGGRTVADDERPYVLFRCQNGAHAIVRVDDDGSLSLTASYVEVR